MKLAIALFLATTTSSILAAPIAGSEALRSGRTQVMAVDLNVLRHEFHEVGWQHSFYVHLDDTYASFVSHQLNFLADGDYSSVVPEVRDLAEDLDRDARSLARHDVRGGWEPVGWDVGDEGHELLVLKRRVR